MSEPVQVKVCGITRAADAKLALEQGANCLGFIFVPTSPRAVGFDDVRKVRAEIPACRTVYVQIRPSVEELQRAVAEGFAAYQLYCPASEDRALVQAWSAIASPEKLWLAPKIGPEEDFPEDLLPLAETFLIDTYSKDAYGGTGKTGNWDRFREWAERWPEKRWILAGGLKPENVAEAVRGSGASFLDVSSGVEEAPGRKSPERVSAFFAAVRM